MLNALMLGFLLGKAKRMSLSLSSWSPPTLTQLIAIGKLQRRIIELQTKTKTVASWSADIKYHFPNIAMMFPQEKKIERLTFKSLPRF